MCFSKQVCVNSKDLYVYLDSGDALTESHFITTSRTVTFDPIYDGDLTPDTKNTLVNSCRISDYPRFTTEFIIEARQ